VAQSGRTEKTADSSSEGVKGRAVTREVLAGEMRDKGASLALRLCEDVDSFKVVALYVSRSAFDSSLSWLCG
jgi:hypothetical protein